MIVPGSHGASTVVDATYSERLPLLQSSPERYFREYPMPRWGFRRGQSLQQEEKGKK